MGCPLLICESGRFSCWAGTETQMQGTEWVEVWRRETGWPKLGLTFYCFSDSSGKLLVRQEQLRGGHISADRGVGWGGGRRLQREGPCAYLQLSHAADQQKPTPQCKQEHLSPKPPWIGHQPPLPVMLTRHSLTFVWYVPIYDMLFHSTCEIKDASFCPFLDAGPHFSNLYKRLTRRVITVFAGVWAVGHPAWGGSGHAWVLQGDVWLVCLFLSPVLAVGMLSLLGLP